MWVTKHHWPPISGTVGCGMEREVALRIADRRYLDAVDSSIRSLASVGVTPDQSPDEQRRVRTTNVTALFAFFATAFFAVVFLPNRPDSLPLWAFGGMAIAYLMGYTATIALNWQGRHDWAVVALLATGFVNVVGATFTVGFDAGPALFMVTVSIGAVLLTRGEQRPTRWFFVALGPAAFAALAMLDPPVADTIAGTRIGTLLVAMSYGGAVAFAVTVVWYQRRLADMAEDALTEANALSDRLLLNILPADIARRLKTDEYPIADREANVAILFADIVDSTSITEQLTPNELVSTLDGLFSSFDDIGDEYGLEKIKTVGDNYFSVAGLGSRSGDHVTAAADAALRMRGDLVEHHFPGIGQVHMRFGIHTGPVVAGVIGKRKFSYDLWGDTVNTASRMESTSETDMIQVSEEVYNLLKDEYDLEPRGDITAKGKGRLSTYALERKRTQKRKPRGHGA